MKLLTFGLSSGRSQGLLTAGFTAQQEVQVLRILYAFARGESVPTASLLELSAAISISNLNLTASLSESSASLALSEAEGFVEELS